MQCDEVIWDTINNSFCSYKIQTKTQTFCRNEYNLTGLCSRQSCPLANSRYATIKEIDGTLYLFVKTIERAHSPAKLWEKIKLSKNYAKALGQIDNELEYFPKFIIHKCKQRTTKITQYLIRMRRLVLKTKPKLVGVNRTIEKRQAKREGKAEVAAKLTTSIEKELLDRMRRGVYATDGIMNESTEAFTRALDTIEDMEEEIEEDLMDREFVSDFSESDDDLEDFNKHEDSDDSSSCDDEDIVQKKQPKRMVEVEYENENQTETLEL